MHIPGSDSDVTTDADGTFTVTGVPVGPINIEIDASVSSRPQIFPTLHFEANAVAGRNNQLPTGPIRIPPLVSDAQMVGGDQDVVLQMPGVPGLTLTVFANSTSFPDGSTEGLVSINQVHLDKIPMPPPSGTIFMPPAWTVQPPGVHFDPPAKITIPNDGLPPGRVIDIFQFDHDINRFVNVGPGTTDEEGFLIVSDPGYGITKSGWGGCGQPQPPTTCTCSCNDSNTCTADSCSGQPNCSCTNTFMPDMPLPASEQDPGDCKTLKCSGFDPADGETPDIKDPQCNKCEGGNAQADTSKNDMACDPSGDPKKACYVCKDGSCGPPDCNPDGFTKEIKGDFGPLSSKLEDLEKKINDGLKKAARGKPLSASVNFGKFEGGAKQSFVCCPDCTEPPPSEDGWEQMEYTLGASASATGTLGYCGNDTCLFRKVLDLWFFAVRVQAGVTGTPSVSLTLKAEGTGTAQVIDMCPADTCGVVKGSLTLSGSAQAGAGVTAGGSLFDDSDPGCPNGIKPKAARTIDACWGGGSAGCSAEAFTSLTSSSLASVTGELRFPLPGQQCLTSGGSCTYRALNAALKFEWKGTCSIGPISGEIGDRAVIPLFRGISGPC